MTELAQLLPSLAQRPDALVGWRGDEPVYAAALLCRVQAWQQLLQAQRGRNFALYLEDSLEFGAALLGAWQASKTIWLTADTLDASCAALRRSVDGFLGEFPVHCGALQPQGDVPAPQRPAALASDFEALVVHTSGTTSAAVAIPKRLSQLASEVAVLEQMFGVTLGDAAVLATVSHQHIYGLLFKLLWPLCAGRPLHAASAAFPETLAAMLARRPSLLVASPAHLKRLPQLAGWQGARAMLRAVYSSGGPLPEEAALECGAMLGTVPMEVYGSSETGGVAWRQRGGSNGDSWTPFPNVQWRLVGDALEVRSPHLGDDNWLALADRARAAGDKRFALLGRADRVVKIEEKRVSLQALEAALSASPLVAEARVLPLDGEGAARTQLCAFVQPSPSGTALLAGAGKLALNQALRAALAGAVEAVAMPRRWRYLQQWPVNAQGKTTQAALLALLESDPRPTAPQCRLLERQPERVQLELTVPPDLLYFDGHFPQQPILPGVVQLDWAIAFAREYFPLPPLFRDVAMLKFQQVIVPGATVQLELVHDVAKGSVQFRYLSAAGQHASGRVLFAQEP
jgi:acyl-CoA synthetase (AMP-forming)/AMP-acid ligase II/3-hydroxymyristoyl/3-hydroxydecanoyl-(acyl carrier protein) dehydratase